MLIIKSRNDTRRYEFKEGERLKLQLKDTRDVLNGSWHYESDSAITMSGQIVDLRNIYWVDISKKEKGIWLLRKGQDLLILAGMGYFAVSQINSLLQEGETVKNARVLRVSASLIVAGLVCRGLDRVLRKRKIPTASHRFRIYLTEQF